ncbi:MAG: LysR family transcriptional regulator [Myxococcota bacterium]|nr:LysR family transcriptional regulator [Myxococcota bacterium]
MYSHLPDLESLRCFMAAVQTMNFRKAAQLVHLSPSAFTERIQKLESELDVVLFIRSTRHIALSEEGARLLPFAKRLLDEAQAFQFQATEKPAEVTLTFGTRYELGLSFVLPFLERSRIDFPSQNVQLFFGDAPSLTNALLASEIDLVFSSMRLDHAQINIQTTHQEDYVLVARPQLAAQVTQIADLRTETLVDLSPAFPLCRYFAEPHKLNPRILFGKNIFLGTIAALLYWVKRQAAFAVLPHYFVKDELASGELSVVLPRMDLQHDFFRVFWRHGHWAETTIQQIADRMADCELR